MAEYQKVHLPESCRSPYYLCPQKTNKIMEIKQLEPKEKVLTFFGEFKSATEKRSNTPLQLSTLSFYRHNEIAAAAGRRNLLYL